MLEFRKTCVSYPDGKTALKEFSFEFADGETYAVLGANGAGKSTLMRAVLGLAPISGGGISVNGLDVSAKNLSKIRAVCGMVFQNSDDQLFCASVEDDVAFGVRNVLDAHAEVLKTSEAYLNKFNLEHLRRRSSSRLSEGEKKRVALCSVMAMEPKILLLDEPTAQLDPRGANEICEVLDSLRQTKIIAIHDLKAAERLCRTALILKDGSLFAHGNTADVLADTPLLKECGLI